eukprot:3077032-Rhodomonas_salina.1
MCVACWEPTETSEDGGHTAHCRQQDSRKQRKRAAGMLCCASRTLRHILSSAHHPVADNHPRPSIPLASGRQHIIWITPRPLLGGGCKTLAELH